jgi:coiled-coil domain-containing protein 12
MLSLQDKGEPLTEEAPTAKNPKLLQQALEEAQQEVTTTTLVITHPTNVVKKINWDLKRDIQPQLDRLEQRTQLCIVDLLKERLAQEAQADDLD